MDDFIKVTTTTELQPGHMKTYWVSGKPVALANVDGEYFAIDDTCSHEKCSLGTEGALDGNVVICGCHGSMFDVTRGTVMSLPAISDVRNYEVKIEGDIVLMKI